MTLPGGVEVRLSEEALPRGARRNGRARAPQVLVCCGSVNAGSRLRGQEPLENDYSREASTLSPNFH